MRALFSILLTIALFTNLFGVTVFAESSKEYSLAVRLNHIVETQSLKPVYIRLAEGPAPYHLYQPEEGHWARMLSHAGEAVYETRFSVPQPSSHTPPEAAREISFDLVFPYLDTAVTLSLADPLGKEMLLVPIPTEDQLVNDFVTLNATRRAQKQARLTREQQKQQEVQPPNVTETITQPELPSSKPLLTVLVLIGIGAVIVGLWVWLLLRKKGHKSGFTLIELLVVVGIVGILASVAVISLNTGRSKARDTKRVTDMRSITTALQLYLDNENKLPDNTDDDAGGWDVGNTKLPAGDTFILPLQDKGILQAPREAYFSPESYTTYRYFKYEDEQYCGGTYAIVAIRLENKKQSIGASNTLESCYINNFNAVPIDDYWLANMIREY